MTPGNTKPREPLFGLSATALLATALAAITATFLASYLGVAGTIIGAAVASVATAIGKEVYTHSIRSTRERVRVVVRADPSSRTIVVPLPGPDHDAGNDADAGTRTLDDAPVLPGSGPASEDRLPARAWRRVAFTAAAVFVAVLALVTTVEVVTGRPITDLIRGKTGSGTTLFGTDDGGGKGKPVPAITETVTPSVVVITPTITQIAPPVTEPATPDSTPTSTTEMPSDAPSESATPIEPVPVPVPPPTDGP